MDKVKKSFMKVREDMDRIFSELEQIRDIQGIILDKIGIEAAELEAEEIEEEIKKEKDEDLILEDDEEEFQDCADCEECDICGSEFEESEFEESELEEEEPIAEGNFMATKTGKRYHVLSCNLVKNVAEKNKLMFDTAEDAEEEGFIKCHCVK